MLKEGNNRVNVNRVLLGKQILDSIVLLIVLAALFLALQTADLEPFGLFLVFLAAFVFLCIFFILSAKYAKKPINTILIEAAQKTGDEINIIQQKSSFQKENYAISDDKIKGMGELVSTLVEYAAQTKELTNSIQDKTAKSLEFTNSEHVSVKSNIEKMFSIRHKIQTIAELILELSDFVQSISSTIGLVEDIAEQTNLLALNAAVEAARAGEHGKGFAVVASEIRKLADESKQATAKITSLINDIQQTANSTVLATEEGTKEIESGLELAHLISDNIEHLIDAMGEISSDMDGIITSSDKITSDAKKVGESVDEFSKIVENNKKISDEKNAIYEKIEDVSKDLKQSVI